MDTVSEHDLAIALAREGGMGVIHRACQIDEQVVMVSRVKRSENAVILKPHTVRKEDTVDHVREIMAKNGFSGFPSLMAKGILRAWSPGVMCGISIVLMRPLPM
jgi:IMP dehydrogenase